MSWCNALRRAGPDYGVNDISPGTFADFCLKIFTQKKISSYGDISAKSSTVMYRFKYHCQCVF